MSFDSGRRGDSSPTDSGVDTREWEESHKAGPRMSLDPYNFGPDSAWTNRNGVDPKRNGSDKRPSSMVKSSGSERSPKGSAKFGAQKPEPKKPQARAASQFPARTNFLLEHLASFTLRTTQEAQIPAKERLAQTKDLLAKGSLWTKEMEMRLTDTEVVLLDGETQDVVEVYPLSTIGHVEHLSDDSDLNSVLVFNTLQSGNKIGALHLFQSDRVPAAVVATEIMKACSSKEAMPNRYASRGGVMLPPPPTHPAPAPPKEVDQERLDLYEKSLVAQTIAAFSAVSESSTKKPDKPQVSSKYQASEAPSDVPDDALSAELLEARTNRDVQILNHCIDDIENLIIRTKRSAEAWKKLQKKKGKIKQSSLTLEARPPPEADFYDAFQKFKHAFNLLAKLRQHIFNPNAAELVHYLFVPLSLLVRCTGGPDKAKPILIPLLSTQAVDLLQNCLSSKETEFWMLLGPNWTLPRSNKHFKDQFIPPYTPVFKDGWVPPGVIAGKDVSNLSAAIAANAAAVAQLNDEHRKGDDLSSNPQVLAAAAKFRRLTSVKKDDEQMPTSPTKKGLRKVRIIYDFQARNSKELTVRQGEEVAVLLDSRQWWCVRNAEGAIGFVPHTIIEESVALPSPPTTAPPPVPTSEVTSTSTTKTESTVQLSKAPTPPKPYSSKAPTPPKPYSSKAPIVELRHVEQSKVERPVAVPPFKLVVPPPPPTSPPPATPPPTPPAPIVIKVKDTPTAEKEPTAPVVTDFTKAILAKNLKKVDQDAEQKRREDAQKKRMSSTDMLNDELKRRMTGSQGGLTPRPQRKDALPSVDLNPDSNPDVVRDWLKSKGFSDSCIAAVSGKSSKDLEFMTKDQMKQLCGDAEGSRMFSQFAVQKANWKVTNKGSELAFIMQKRKERVEERVDEGPGNGGELRVIVADAKAAAAKEENEARQNTSSTALKAINVGPPAVKQRPKSYAAPENKPPSDSEADKRSPTDRKSSRGASFDDSEFIPPPPVWDSEQEPSRRESSSAGKRLSTDEVDFLLTEQKKQRDLLQEHEKQLYLLEQLQRQKLELEQQKREFEEQQQRHKQTTLQEQQKELQRQIQTQQDQLKQNEGKLAQQQLIMSSYAHAPFTYPQMAPVVPQQIPVVPMGGVSMGPSPYLPLAGLQPMYPSYPTTVAQPSLAQMVPTVGLPSVNNQPST